MNEKLKSYLNEFRISTIDMIDYIQEDQMDKFETELKKREELIEKMKALDFSKSEFKEICDNLNIVEINDTLNKMTKDERDRVKLKIMELKKSQSANNAYSAGALKSDIFSKKV